MTLDDLWKQRAAFWSGAGLQMPPCSKRKPKKSHPKRTVGGTSQLPKENNNNKQTNKQTNERTNERTNQQQTDEKRLPEIRTNNTQTRNTLQRNTSSSTKQWVLGGEHTLPKHTQLPTENKNKQRKNNIRRRSRKRRTRNRRRKNRIIRIINSTSAAETTEKHDIKKSRNGQKSNMAKIELAKVGQNQYT